ncbi:EAL domain-containing protein [Pseudomonas sp. OF001]|uniref:putative bifunctional diguanylate cyclase/phosphodiesterase n=1 Tax=unclassified Pseudomonas TaxID=196821 RepID=UPI0010A62FEC|nr:MULTISPECIES: GGDEF domain-containing phosphodiesterase [unclassified Pseudomonas]THG86797.1 EAL domain-containing protein [Pseudomonas sp. A-1]CAD5375717.1 EAL domain-containing protein [Pseudomonas sp. OF001]
MPPDVQKSLSQRLLGFILLAAVALGLLFSSAQIAHDLQLSRQAIRTEGRQLLGMFREGAALASFREDRRLAEQLVAGLLQHPGVLRASLRDGHGTPLAGDQRTQPAPAAPGLAAELFGPPQPFSLRLHCPTLRQESCGELTLTLDSSHLAERFVAGVRFQLASSLVFILLLGLALFWLCRRQLTLPLARLLGNLTRIDPERPGEHQLPPLRGHERDELGQWVARANQLLAAIAHHQSRRREAESNLQRMSQFDQLTGLPGRPLLQQQLGRLLREANRSQGRVAVLCLGLDDFNSLNEKYGYQAGDRLLVTVAERLRALDSRLAGLARLGGDQFALVQIAFQHGYEVAELAQQVLDALSSPQTIGDQQIRLGATIGITLYPDDGDDGERLLQRAEQTLTLAKQGNRQRYQFFIASLDREIRRRRQLEQDLRQALHSEQLELYYQPQVAGAAQRVVGVEALLRWRHPQLGFVPPDQFIPLAEQSGLILEIGDWVLERACRQLRDWHAQGLEGLRMAINLSTAQLRSEKLPRQVLGLIQRYGLQPYSLELEVTETGLMTNVAQAAQQLNSLRLAKVLLAVDDFGTGYSSLSYLKSLPLDKIKIDRSFVRDLPRNQDDAIIAHAIIQLAHNLDMQVIAEGVETAEQEAYLLAHGCDEGQGYLYCRPLPAFEVTQYLSNALRRAAQGTAGRPLGRLG